MHFKRCFLWITIFLIALFIRTYKLEEVPYGFHVDEVKAGWNAFSILKTGMDDKGNVLPMYYDSFGDFRPTGMFYTIIPSLIIFGKTIFAIRFPAALFGALSIFPIIFIVRSLTDKNKRLELIAAFMMALNPWHIITSRATSEGIISMFFALWGVYFLLKSLKSNRFRDVLFCFATFGVSYFFYHSIRIMAPIIVLAVVAIDFIYVNRTKNYVKQIAVAIGLIILTAVMMSSKEALGRMSQVSLKSDFQVLYEVTKMPNEEGPNQVFVARAFHNRVVSYSRRFLEEYKNYFSTNFLLGDLAKPIRYTTPYVGLLLYIEILFIFFGLILVREKKNISYLIILLICSPLTAAVTIEDTPNLQRSLLMAPFIVLIAAYGMNMFFDLKGWKKIFRFLFLFLYILNFIYFYHMYIVHEKFGMASYYRDGGNVELVQRLSTLENKYDGVLLSNSPDSLIPWVAFFNDFDPAVFNKAVQNKNDGNYKFGKYIFSKDKCPSENLLKSTDKVPNDLLIIDAEGCEINPVWSKEKKVELLEIIKRPDGSPPYYLRTIY